VGLYGRSLKVTGRTKDNGRRLDISQIILLIKLP
jgi:hypothetical protein